MADAVLDRRAATARLALERKTRRLFWCALLLNAIIAVHFVFAARTLSGPLWSLLPAALLWSLVVTGYAFHMLSGLATERRRKLDTAFTDERTGVFTLGYLKSSLEHERRRAAEGASEGTAVIYVDMVQLDKVNRTMGYAVGDIVLRSLAQLIADSARRGDVVGRVGGDEFLVIMPESRPEQTEDVVAAICRAIEGFRLDVGKKGVIDYLGCKLGVAMFPKDGETPEEVIAAARARIEGAA